MFKIHLLFICTLIGLPVWAQSLDLEAQKQLRAAQTQLNSGQIREAASALQQLYANYPDNASIANQLAVSLFRSGRSHEAEDILDGFISRDRQLGPLFDNLKKMLEHSAAVAYSQALSKDSPELPALALQQSSDADFDLIAAERRERIAAVEVRLRDFIRVWERGDVERYLDFYTSQYRPSGFRNHQQWRAQRQRLVSPERKIDIEIAEVEMVTRDNPDLMIARFRQDYTARGYTDSVRKEITWQKLGGQWLIVKEISIT